jgi:hypothetical protein
MKTVVSRDPFARSEVVRVDVECAGCARRARFQYGVEHDGIRARVHWSPVLVCSLACHRGLRD